MDAYEVPNIVEFNVLPSNLSSSDGQKLFVISIEFCK